ncbi:MAG: hypothetical protein M1820_002908 [Bogoriella megaspora]|nr:MAG: hypothetical protein M1820_002908 [Bogoriella megaspora]
MAPSDNPKPPKPLLTTIPPINPEPVELDGTPTSPRAPPTSFAHTLSRLPRADTLDSTGTPSTATTVASPNINIGGVGGTLRSPGQAAIAEASIEGARVGAGVDEAALRMNGEVKGRVTGEGELVGREGEEGLEEEQREHRAALISSRSRDPAVLVDIPQIPAAEELKAVGADGESNELNT